MITPREAGDLYPVMRTDDLHGAMWIPGDGKANPADLCMSLAKGARNRGVRVIEEVEVTDVMNARGGERVGRRANRAGDARLRGVATAPASGRASLARWPVSTCRCTRPSTSTS